MPSRGLVAVAGASGWRAAMTHSWDDIKWWVKPETHARIQARTSVESLLCEEPPLDTLERWA